MTPGTGQGGAVDATYRLGMAIVLGVPYGPRSNPGAGRLPAEIGEGVPEWAEVRAALAACVRDWQFTGSAGEAKVDAREAIAARLADKYTLMSAEARYKVLVDPITGEIYGHIYDGWIYQGPDPLEIRFDASSGAFASILFSTRIVS